MMGTSSSAEDAECTLTLCSHTFLCLTVQNWSLSDRLDHFWTSQMRRDHSFTDWHTDLYVSQANKGNDVSQRNRVKSHWRTNREDLNPDMCQEKPVANLSSNMSQYEVKYWCFWVLDACGAGGSSFSVNSLITQWKPPERVHSVLRSTRPRTLSGDLVP